jgi:outer membrane lipoprotein SlyB
MKNISYIVLSLITMVMLLTTGCFSMDANGSTYTRDEVKSGNKIYFAEIIAIDNVTIEGTSGTIGGASGAVLGGLVGSTVGGGTGRDIATAVGAIGGALIGAKAENSLTRTKAIEISVKYELGGECEAIVQTPDNDNFQVGQRVRVLVDSKGTKRVRPFN